MRTSRTGCNRQVSRLVVGNVAPVEPHIETESVEAPVLHCKTSSLVMWRVKGVLQLSMNRYGYICFAHVHERVSTKSFVVFIIGSNSKSNQLGVQGTFNACGLVRNLLGQ